MQSYAVAYGWGAGLFAVGAVLSVLLLRRCRALVTPSRFRRADARALTRSTPLVKSA